VAAALPALADRVGEAPSLRTLSAAFRRGERKDAEALASVSIRSPIPAELRRESIKALAAWARPTGKERVTGLWRPISPRDPAPARVAIGAAADALLADPSDEIRRESIRALADLGVAGARDPIRALFQSQSPASVRVEALQAILRLDPAASATLIPIAARDENREVRREGIRLAPQLNPEVALEVLTSAAEDGPVEIRQAAIGALGRLPGQAVDAPLSRFLDRLLEGALPATLHLDVLEASAGRSALQGRLAELEGRRKADDPLAGYREALEGGDAASGRKIFFERSTVACLKCHKSEGKGGDVGPAFATIGKDRTREQILESIVYPNRQISQGYGQEIFRTASDAIEVGRVKAETETHVTLVLADGRERRLAKGEISARKAGLSAMPDDIAKSLSKRDVRDLVAYLFGLR
jgi:quinoprotein glucose dehydrogenase